VEDVVLDVAGVGAEGVGGAVAEDYWGDAAGCFFGVGAEDVEHCGFADVG